jgi:capsid protein
VQSREGGRSTEGNISSIEGRREEGVKRGREREDTERRRKKGIQRGG